MQEASDRHFAEVEEAKMRKEGTWDAHVAAVNKAAEDKKKAEEEVFFFHNHLALIRLSVCVCCACACSQCKALAAKQQYLFEAQSLQGRCHDLVCHCHRCKRNVRDWAVDAITPERPL